jgi:O-antigen/teichoic acid export membrane protein
LASLRPTARVARGATYLFAQGFFTAIVSVVYFVVFAHAVPQEDMGVFALLSFILSMAPTLGTFALPSAAIKYIAQHIAENDSKKAKAVVTRVLQVGFLVSSFVFVLLFIPAEQVSSLVFGTASYALLLRLLAFYSIFAILSVEVTSFLQGLQRMRELALINLAYTVISSGITIYLLFLGWRLYAVAIGWLVGQAIASVAGLILTTKFLGIFEKPYAIRTLWNFSAPLYVSGGIGFFVSWIDQLLLVSYMSLLYGATEAQRILGVYYVAIRASAVPSLFSSSVVTALFPQLTALYTQQGADSFKDAFRVSVRYAVLVGFPMITGVAALAYPIIILFAGFKYVGAVWPLIIICLGALVGTLGIAVSPILMTLERTKIVSLLAIISVCLSIFFSYFALAVLGLGMVGTAWARTFAGVIALVLNLYVLTRYVPVSFDKEAIWKASVASILMVLAIVGLDMVRMFLAPSSYQFLVFRLYLLPIYIIVGALAYLASMVGLRAIKKQDVELIYEYLPKNMKWVADWLGRIAMVE